ATPMDAENDTELWPERFDAILQPFLSQDAILELKKMYLEGPEPPRQSDKGWTGRQSTTMGNSQDDISERTANPNSSMAADSGERSIDRSNCVVRAGAGRARRSRGGKEDNR